MPTIKTLVASLLILLCMSSMALADTLTGTVSKIQQKDSGLMYVSIKNSSTTTSLKVAPDCVAAKQFLAILLTAQTAGDDVTVQYNSGTKKIEKITLK